MRYLVLLDPRSIAGLSFLENNDGIDTTGCPVIDCSELNPHGVYLSCTRDTKSRGGKYQELLIPHSAVAYVFCYAKEADRPIGFAPRQPD